MKRVLKAYKKSLKEITDLVNGEVVSSKIIIKDGKLRSDVEIKAGDVSLSIKSIS